jgi:serine/threonine protein kinase
MGAVYAGTHARNGKRVAVKVLHPGIDGGDVLARFQREGYLANLVDDPGAVAVFDDGVTDDGIAFLVMERLEGESIEDRAQRYGGRLPWAEILAIVHPALTTLGKAHAAGVVHRDLKPSNLFLTKAGQIKLLDFGLAGHTAGAPGVRLTGPMTPTMGTLGFMPAEQAVGDWPNVDARSDLWSMGATMFALATGLCPHESGNEQGFFHRVLTASAPRLCELVPDAPASFAAIVDRALLRDRASRFGSAEQMADAVQQAYYEFTGEEVAHVSSGAKRLVPSPRPTDLIGEESTLSDGRAGHDRAVAKLVTLESAGLPIRPEGSLTPASAPQSARGSAARGWRVPIVLGLAGSALAVAAVVYWPRESAPRDTSPEDPALADGLARRDPGASATVEPQGPQASPLSTPPRSATPITLAPASTPNPPASLGQSASGPLPRAHVTAYATQSVTSLPPASANTTAPRPSASSRIDPNRRF